MKTEPLLQVKDLVVNFAGGVEAVRGVDLTVGAGETGALVGESGCGKSVTALSIMQLIQEGPRVQQSGSIIFQGQQLLGAPRSLLNSIRGQRMSIIFQEPLSALNPLMTVGKQIAEVLVVHLAMDWATARNRALDLLGHVQIDRPAECYRQYPHQLSGGQRQRVMLAMALACSPQLLIADEPTTALDVTVQAQILDLLRELQRVHHLALLLITHDLGVVAELADRIYVMYSGKIVEEGGARQVLQQPQHPYTAGLIASYPELGDTDDQLKVIAGNVPDPANLPSGCAFHPRCPCAQTECKQKVPLLADGKACFYPLKK